MPYTLLYSPDVSEARAFISEFDGKGQILSTPEQCASFGQPFSGYPTVVYEDTEGGYHSLYKPASWQEVQSWSEFVELRLKAPKPTKTEFTKTEFKRLFTLEELDALILAGEVVYVEGADDSVVDVKRLWNLLQDSDIVSMADPLTINSLYLLVLGGYITEARFEEIKKGVTKI